MSEAIQLQQMIEDAIRDFCAKSGFGVPNGFIYCVSRINNDGNNVYTFGSAEHQDTILSLGMASYLHKAFECDVVDELEAASFGDDD